MKGIIFICQKAPINGNLDGQWEVVEVNPHPEVEILDQRLFYNFYRHVCQLTYYGGFFFRWQYAIQWRNLVS